jgi:hypothetical protein
MSRRRIRYRSRRRSARQVVKTALLGLVIVGATAVLPDAYVALAYEAETLTSIASGMDGCFKSEWTRRRKRHPWLPGPSTLSTRSIEMPWDA